MSKLHKFKATKTDSVLILLPQKLFGPFHNFSSIITQLLRKNQLRKIQHPKKKNDVTNLYPSPRDPSLSSFPLYQQPIDVAIMAIIDPATTTTKSKRIRKILLRRIIPLWRYEFVFVYLRKSFCVRDRSEVQCLLCFAWHPSSSSSTGPFATDKSERGYSSSPTHKHTHTLKSWNVFESVPNLGYRPVARLK